MSIQASQAVAKWVTRSGAAGQDYADGVRNTTKDQSALAIASFENYKAGLTASFTAGRFVKGLQKSGKSGWQNGALEKGVNNYPTGVASESAKTKYVTNSGKYDAARNSTAGKPRGPKGSPANIAYVTTVVAALRAAKLA